MAKNDITKTELVWPGKYNEDGTLKEVPRVSLPFQVIETVNESRATRETQKAATIATVRAMDTVANSIGARQRVNVKAPGILTPAENREINTATSVNASSSADSLSGLKWNRLSALGPTNIPTPR